MSEYDQFKERARAYAAERKDLRGVDVANDWLLLLTEEEIQRGVRKVASELNRVFEGQDIVVVSILKGCVYFFVDLTRCLTIPYSTYFIEASSYHDEQIQSESVELLSKIVPSKFENKKIVLLDELYDNGATLEAVKRKLMEVLGKSSEDIYTCCLFTKEKPSNHFPLPDLCGFPNTPNVWVVGYGLDDAQEKRGWKDLWAIPKAPGLSKVDADAMFDASDEGKQSWAAARQRLLSALDSA
eukprot:TRINITY_DN4588_c0_g1_i2.p1 TRINITY_DN4588_c0_g1~~TRINITY_DN4588_c0_g1_i2.p1  ORF type:complete len:283 (+),score=68.64 TRINITY_DN4588_c0_g1_i2:127-849(+)